MSKLIKEDIDKFFIEQFQAFENSLNGESKKPLHAERKTAIDKFKTAGFPHAKDEEYKYSNIAKTFGRLFSLDNMSDGAFSLSIDEASKYFDFTQAQKAVKEGLSLAQKINPDVPIKAFPIVFLFMPRYGDAKALHGQGCAININALKPTKVSNDPSYQKIVSYVAHESTHLFLKQLDKKTPPFSIRTDPLDKGIYDFLWEEGLTTYIEPTHYRHHEGFVQDAKFWINTVESWLKAENALVKERILKDCTKREATISWFEDMSSSKEAPNLDGLNEQELDVMFLRMLTEMNGPAYHVGSYLWKKQIDKGKELKDLVMLGSGEMKKWIQEEQ